ncbi:HTH-type transcriptional regulator MhqR [mine drainage metagenome]|uniref:HTH-type transcriptional regulator MhqR n=1 Tax=mine drainage metagenome TaxID=410659 RepID=A0A1J5Q660_9ZZZZ
MPKDAVTQIVDQWREQRPDLDPSPMGTLGRLSRSSLLVDRALNALFAQHGLQASEFDILATLRRSGHPFTLNPSQLSESLMVNSSTMTNRLDRLEGSGRIRRVTAIDDRRALLVELTPKGLKLVDHVVEFHLKNEEEILSVFSENEKKTLEKLLSKLERHLAQ